MDEIPDITTCKVCRKRYTGADNALRCRITGNKVEQLTDVVRWCPEFDFDNGKVEAICWITPR